MEAVQGMVTILKEQFVQDEFDKLRTDIRKTDKLLDRLHFKLGISYSPEDEEDKRKEGEDEKMKRNQMEDKRKERKKQDNGLEDLIMVMSRCSN
jgi:hypothetical protein